MAIYVEQLNGGFVNARPALTLNPGEFQDGAGLTYVPNNQALVRASTFVGDFGFPSYGSASTATNPVYGLRVLSFLNSTQYLIAGVDTSLYRVSPTSAVSWSTLLSGVSAGNYLDVASYGNRHYIFNGSHPNQCSYLNGSTLSIRRQGAVAVSAGPAVNLVTSATQAFGAATGVYEYWYTEVISVTEGSSAFEIESDFTGKGSVVTVATTAQAPVINRADPPYNSNATGWRVYRGFRAASAQSAFPVGVKIADLAIAVTAVTNGTANSIGPFRPTASAQAGTSTWTNLAGVTAGTQGDANAANIAMASSPKVGTLTLTYSAITAVEPPITGIQVFVRDKRASFLHTTGLTCYISGDANATTTAQRGVAYSAGNGYLATSAQYNIGGNGDLWGKSQTYWNATTLSATNFRVNLQATTSGPNSTGTWDVDDCEVTVFQQGSDTVLGAFPSYSVSVDGNTTQGTLLGIPPISSTGDVFEGSLVVNDVASPGIFRYSSANQPEYFPDIYFGRLDLGKNEPITCIRTVGNRMIIATQSTLWRVNYLPRFQDSQFDRGRPLDLISGDLGIASPKAATLFTSQRDGRPMLAFFNSKGLFATDGYEIQQFSSDIDWATLLGGRSASAVSLVNNEYAFSLCAMYPGTSAPGASRRIEFCYHPSHQKQGNELKASCPLRMFSDAHNVNAAAYVNNSVGNPMLFVGTVSGYVNQLGAGTESSYSIITRRISPAGIGEETRLRSFYLTRFEDTTTGTTGGLATVIASASFTNRVTVTASHALTVSAGVNDLSRFDFNMLGELYQFDVLYFPDSPVNKDGIIGFALKGDGFGEEDSIGQGTS